MCGISLVVDSSRQQVEARLELMLQSQRHRGPDGVGQTVCECMKGTWVGLGHNRLAILDLTLAGAQPMTSWDGQHTLIFNGEIYNYIEIARELALPRDETGRCVGDSRVLVEAIARWGPDVFRQLHGMWALACLNHKTGQLLVSRDRFGIKPLYLWTDGHRLLLSSEVKAILSACGQKFELNRGACGRYVAYGLLDTDLSTMFGDIRAFPPSHFALIDPSRPATMPLNRYWAPPEQCTRSGTDADADELRTRLTSSISMHLRSDVPVGILLSGGIDSSAVAGIATRLGTAHVATALSVVSDDASLDESRFIDDMANYAGIKTTKVNVSQDPMELLDTVTEATWANDQPLCALSDVSHFMLMRLARSLGLKVLLSGQGSDEQFGGYNKFFYFYLKQLLRHGNLLAAATLVARALARSDVLREFRLGEAARYIGSSKLATAGLIHSGNQQLLAEPIGAGRTYSERERRDLSKLSLPALLHYEDRMSMWNSIEVRVPFLDHRVVELGLSLSPHSKFACGRPKSILRRALNDLIPESIRLRRDKKGFGIPESKWIGTTFRPAFEEMLRSDMRASGLGVLDQHGVRSGYDLHLRGKAIPNGRQLMRVLLLERFLERFSQHIDGA